MNDHVQIILGSYNGSRFLREQLDSLLKQTHQNWSLLVTDDGSTDGTLAIVSDFETANPEREIKVIQGPRRGFAKNFLFGLRAAKPAPFYAFCDQDDIWLPERLSMAIETIGGELRPAIAGGRTQYISETGELLGLSPLFSRAPSFRNALVQSLFGGNTITMNRAMRDLLVQDIPDAVIVSHDWWGYLLCTGAGGTVHYLAEPTVLYRQHNQNLVGGGTGLAARLDRVKRGLQQQFREWTDHNLTGLNSVSPQLTPTHRKLVLEMTESRRTGPLTSLAFSRREGLYRQTWLGDISLIGLILLRRL